MDGPALEFGSSTSISPTLFASMPLPDEYQPSLLHESIKDEETPTVAAAITGTGTATTGRVSARRQSLLQKRQLQQEQQEEMDRLAELQHARAQMERRRKLKESHERKRREKEQQQQQLQAVELTKLKAKAIETYEKDPRKQEQLMSNLLEMLGKGTVRSCRECCGKISIFRCWSEAPVWHSSSCCFRITRLASRRNARDG
jgi:hypothetical protein